jgi:hypothetical protein
LDPIYRMQIRCSKGKQFHSAYIKKQLSFLFLKRCQSTILIFFDAVNTISDTDYNQLVLKCLYFLRPIINQQPPPKIPLKCGNFPTPQYPKRYCSVNNRFCPPTAGRQFKDGPPIAVHTPCLRHAGAGKLESRAGRQKRTLSHAFVKAGSRVCESRESYPWDLRCAARG